MTNTFDTFYNNILITDIIDFILLYFPQKHFLLKTHILRKSYFTLLLRVYIQYNVSIHFLVCKLPCTFRYLWSQIFLSCRFCYTSVFVLINNLFHKILDLFILLFCIFYWNAFYLKCPSSSLLYYLLWLFNSFIILCYFIQSDVLEIITAF